MHETNIDNQPTRSELEPSPVLDAPDARRREDPWAPFTCPRCGDEDRHGMPETCTCCGMRNYG